MQVYTSRSAGNYKGSGDAIIKILKSEGPMGLYRGALPTILKQGTNQVHAVARSGTTSQWGPEHNFYSEQHFH